MSKIENVQKSYPKSNANHVLFATNKYKSHASFQTIFSCFLFHLHNRVCTHEWDILWMNWTWCDLMYVSPLSQFSSGGYTQNIIYAVKLEKIELPYQFKLCRLRHIQSQWFKHTGTHTRTHPFDDDEQRIPENIINSTTNTEPKDKTNEKTQKSTHIVRTDTFSHVRNKI